METRKAQLTGGSTYTVSLPKEWAREIGLETGDTLRLYTRSRTLIVEPASDGDRWEAAVDVGGGSESKLRRSVQALYTTGFDRVSLRGPGGLGDNRRVISATARKLIGFETIESTSGEVRLQSLLDSTTVSVEQSTVQLQQVALSMHADAVRALIERDEDLAEQVVERDDQVDRLYAMISRHFQRSLVSPRETAELELDQAQLYDYQTTARQLERVADHAEKMATIARRFEDRPAAPFDEEIETAAESAREIVRRASSTILGDADVEVAHDALDERDELTGRLQELERGLHEREVAESHLIALALESLVRTAEYGANVAETALQTAARDGQL